MGVEKAPSDRTLVIVTPHVQQIRDEFGRGFSAWYERTHGQTVAIDWRTPGGTTEIQRQLGAEYAAALRSGKIKPDGSCEPGVIGYDLMFGGGSYDHGQLKNPVEVKINEQVVAVSISVPAGFSQEEMDGWFGANRVGPSDVGAWLVERGREPGDVDDLSWQLLYDPEQYWIGTALSGFGIVYNRDVLNRKGIPLPATFEDLTRYEFFGRVALADPRQSGSVTTTYDSILNSEGWDEGWKILREMSANARYFASGSTRPPQDVSQGDAYAGVAIDFYGRGQAQAVMRPGETADTSRVGYVDPEGVFIDADPISVLRGGPHPELAREFIRYCLTEEAQALWQFPAETNEVGAIDNPVAPGTDMRMGPKRYELRRMPVRRVMYEMYGNHFIDQVDPFALVSGAKSRGWRGAIAPLMACFAINAEEDLEHAWVALNEARQAAERGSISAGLLHELETAFHAMPVHVMKDGREVTLGPATYREIRADAGKWRDPIRGKRALISYTRQFKENYKRVTATWRRHKEGAE